MPVISAGEIAFAKRPQHQVKLLDVAAGKSKANLEEGKVDGRPVGDVVRRLNGTIGTAAVPPGTPSHLFLGDDLLHILTIVIGIYTEENEGLVGELLHERPLVGVHGPALSVMRTSA
jgi:hypothetical protein